MSQSTKVHFPHLDGWRFIAFFSVFLFHSFHTEHQHIKDDGLYQAVTNFFSHGYLGVNFFFVLSGFLITYLLLQERKVHERINVPFFYVRRILRIWPLYFACVAFGFIAFPYLKEMMGQVSTETADPIWYVTFIGNLDIVQNHQLPDSSVLGVLWSVAIEEQFYLFWPLLLLLFMRLRAALYGILIAGTIVFRFLHAHDPVVLEFHTLSVISDMAVGGFLADYCFRKNASFNGLPKLQKWHIALIYSAMIATITFKSDLFGMQYTVAIERLVLSLFFAFIIFEQNYAQNSLFKMGRSKFLTYWGKYTYGLYCLHFIGILVMLQLNSGYMGQLKESIWGVLLLDTVVALSISMCLAWLSYHLMEKHFLKLKQRFSFILRS